jgi:hypothetical protein
LYKDFTAHKLDPEPNVCCGRLPVEFVWEGEQFDDLWDSHPAEYHVIRMPAGLVRTPRWQQAYGKDYEYSGRVFRLRPWGVRSGFHDMPLKAGAVLVMPYSTNQRWTHEVPFRKSENGRRISVTLRGFQS